MTSKARFKQFPCQRLAVLYSAFVAVNTATGVHYESSNKALTMKGMDEI